MFEWPTGFDRIEGLRDLIDHRVVAMRDPPATGLLGQDNRQAIFTHRTSDAIRWGEWTHLQKNYGGGNARRLKKLPRDACLGSNDHAFAGGLRLWDPHSGVITSVSAALPQARGRR